MADDEGWELIVTAPLNKIIPLKGPGYETTGMFDPHHQAWCGAEAPHFMQPFGPGHQPTHWKKPGAG